MAVLVAGHGEENRTYIYLVMNISCSESVESFSNFLFSPLPESTFIYQYITKFNE